MASFYTPHKGKHIVAALSVRPVPFPSNNFKTAGGILKKTWYIDRWQ